jgi:NodT family efflux transporter outer membrane factor (OMF) lipoprotein
MWTSAMRGEVALAALVLLAACAGPRPPAPTESNVNPPAAWRDAEGRVGPELSATWWDAFGDPGLTRVVAAALADNDDVKIAAARVQELMGEAALAHAQRLPEVDGQVTYQRDRSINPAFGMPQVENVSEPVVAFSFDTDLFGRLRLGDAAARADLLASRAAQADVRLLVAASAARTWFTLRSLDDRLATLRQTLDARQHTMDLARRRVSMGYAAQLDLAQAEAEYHATEQQIPATVLAIRRTEDALSILLGRNPGPIERADGAAEPVLPEVPAAVPSSLLRRRPDIVEAEERVVAAEHDLDASRAAFMPDLRLSANWGHVNSTLLRNPVDVFTIGASVLAPIFDAGRLQAQQDSAAARRNQAAFAYRKAALEAFGQVEDALAATQRVGEQLLALEAQRSALEQSLKIASARYKSGYSPFLDQLDAQRNLLSVQLAIAQARGDMLNAYVTLFQALGGGWDRALIEDGKGTAPEGASAS